MSTNLVIWPVLIPFITAAVLMCFYKNIRLQKIISGISSLCGLAYSFFLFKLVLEDGIQVFWASNWQPPFGIIWTVDLFSAIMVILANIVGTACLFFSFKTIDLPRAKHYYYPVYQLLMVGICGSFITGDIFNLYVMFEIMLMASYVLIVLGSDRGQLRESFKYVLLNIFSSVLFILGVGVLYGMVGTLNMADIAVKIAQVENQDLVTLVGLIFLTVFGLKGAIFPIYFWLPQSYYEPPAAVSALFGGLLTKVGVYAMVRVFTLIFVHNVSFTHQIILVLGVGTMVFGVLGAIGQMDFKRILTYHIISQVGYMVIGLGMYSVAAITGTIYYIAHHIIVKSSLFLLAGTTEKVTGTNDLHKMGGLLNKAPLLGWTFLVSGLSLAGVPPLSGFFSKFVLMEEAVNQGSLWVAAAALLVGFLTLFSMIKIFLYVFWGEEKPVPEQQGFNYKKIIAPACVLVLLSVAMGLGAPVMMEYAGMAAEQLMNPQIYIDAVLNIQ